MLDRLNHRKEEIMYDEEIVKILNVIIIKKKIADRVPGSKWIKDMESKIAEDSNFEQII